jgi:hypothetical protein
MRTEEQTPAPIEQEIVRGLMLMLASTFGVTEGTSLFYAPTTVKAVQAAQAKAQQTGQPLSWPIMYVKLTDANRQVQNPGYNQKSLARHGRYVSLDKTKGTVRKLHPHRVDLGFEVNYLVADQLEAIQFVSDWITLGQENRLNFTVTYYGMGVDIAARLGEQVSIPDKETSVDEALNVFEFTAQINVEGYVTARNPNSDSQVFIVKNVSTGVAPATNVGELQRNPRLLNQALAYRSKP